MLLTKNKPLHLLTGALATFNFLALKLLFKNPARAKTYPGRVFREYMSLVGHDQWASKDIFEIIPVQGIRIILEHLEGQGVGTPIDELAYLAMIARYAEPHTVFEIGTFRGRTALNFALNSPEDCTVYTLDMPPEEKTNHLAGKYAADNTMIIQSDPGIDYRGKDVAGKIKQLYGDSTVFDFTPYYGKIDLVFVDGAHHYEAVKSDTANALSMIKPGGFILWHDFANFGEYNDVTLAILDSISHDKIIQIANTQLAIYHHEAK